MPSLNLILLATLFIVPTAPAQEVVPASGEVVGKADKKKEEKPKIYGIGVEVPEALTFVDIDGKKTSMKSLRGKTVVLAWYSINCPAIRAAGPKINQMGKGFPNRDDIVILTVNSDHRELADAKPEGVDEKGNPLKPFMQIRNYWVKKKMIVPAMIDPGGLLADKFQAKTTPHMFVIDPEGIVRYSGALDNDPRGRKSAKSYLNYVVQAIGMIDTGEKIVLNQTKPYG